MKKSILIAGIGAAVGAVLGAKIFERIGSIKWFETSDFVTLFTKVAGRGETCIFVHGGPGAWSKSFEKMGGERLHSFLRMIYVDQRGCGRSEKAWNKDYSLSRMIADLDEIIAATGEEKVYLMAHSFGGVIATNYVLQHPEKVNGLILATATLNVPEALGVQIEFASKELGIDNINNIVPDWKSKSRFQNAFRALQRAGKRYKLLTENIGSFRKLEQVDASAETVHDFAVRFWNYPEYFNDLLAKTENISVPVLAINATRDNSVGDNTAKLKFPNARVYTFRDAGHLMYYEQNREFVRLVHEFICENLRDEIGTRPAKILEVIAH